MIRTVYEMTDIDPDDLQVSEAKGGNVAVTITGNEKTDMKLTLYPHTALQLKRGLSRLVDADVADPNENGFSIARLIQLRKQLAVYGTLDEDTVNNVLFAYIRLIERVSAASEVTA